MKLYSAVHLFNNRSLGYTFVMKGMKWKQLRVTGWLWTLTAFAEKKSKESWFCIPWEQNRFGSENPWPEHTHGICSSSGQRYIAVDQGFFAPFYFISMTNFYILLWVFIIPPRERLFVINVTPVTQGLWVVFVCHEKQFRGGGSRGRSP